MNEMLHQTSCAPEEMPVRNEPDILRHFHRDHAIHHLRHTSEGDVVDEQQIQIGLAISNRLVNQDPEDPDDQSAN